MESATSNRLSPTGAAIGVLRCGLAVLLFGSVSTSAGTGAPQSPSPPGMVQVTIEVELSCPSCAVGLERRLGRLDHVAGIEVSPPDGQIVLAVEPGHHLDLAAVWGHGAQRRLYSRRRGGHRHRARHGGERRTGPRPRTRLRPSARRRGRPHCPRNRDGRPTGKGVRTLEPAAGRRRTAAGRVIRGPLAARNAAAQPKHRPADEQSRRPERGRRDSDDSAVGESPRHEAARAHR